MTATDIFRSRRRGGTIAFADEDDLRIIMESVFDIRRDTRLILRILGEDDGEEEEEDT
jgi:hypothetical protein